MVSRSHSRASRGSRWRAATRRLARAGRRLARWTRRSIKTLETAPLPVQAFACAAVLLLAWAAANWTYQAIRKPTELFFPVSGVLVKAPDETWRSYRTLFNKHSTAVIPP